MIQIAFCFDENMVHAACVAIASLLDFKEQEDHYNIYCICSSKALESKNKMQSMVEARDEKSDINFINAPDNYDNSYEVRGISTSTYLRLTLHRILFDIDKVIYVDVDVLFGGSLIEIWNVDMQEKLLAGIKGANNFTNVWEIIMKRDYAQQLDNLKKKYINAGILLMNLKEIRKMNPDELWNTLAQKEYHYQDQDILNITCKGRVDFLDIRYNVPAHLVYKEFLKFVQEGLYTKAECERAWKKPVILHYTGEKPWKNRGTNKAKYWWSYVESQVDLKILFDKRTIKNRKTTGLIGKINRHLPC